MQASRNTCNSVATKNLVKVVKYLEFLAKFHSNIPGNGVRDCLISVPVQLSSSVFLLRMIMCCVYYGTLLLSLLSL